MRRSTAKRYIYEARRFKKLTRILTLKDTTQDTIAAFVQVSKKMGYAPQSISSAIRAVERLTRKRFDKPPEPATPLRSIPRTESLARAFEAACVEARAFLAVAFVTGLRLGDLERLSPANIAPDVSRIELQVSKTGKMFVCPIPAAVRDQVQQYRRIPRKRLYKCLSDACEQAGVDHITPHAIRRLAACSYEQAYPGAGRAILGHYAGVTGRYIPDAVILERAQERLVIPWLPQSETAETHLVGKFRRLSSNDRDAVLRVVSAMG